MFDPEIFLSTETTESTSTEYIPIPEGDYLAMIDKLEVRQAKDSYLLDVQFRLDAPGIEEANEKAVRYSIFLDLTPNGAVDFGKGKNVKLGRLREAIGQNATGQSWSPMRMQGQPAKVTVKNRLHNGQVYSDVTAVTKP